ncbi:hypothetical protein ACFLT4_00260 [Chloroflexota bacterium]
MKLICTIVGCVIALVGTLLSPWPQFILGVVNKMLAVPAAADDVIFQNIVKVSATVATYVLFPVLGGVLGYVIGFFWERKFD